MNIVKAVKNCGSRITSLNLASNMISGYGIELILQELIQNTTLKSLNLGAL